MNSIMKANLMMAVAAGGMLLGGCASPQSGTNFSRNEALRSQRTYYGVIESVTEGRIDGTKTGGSCKTPRSLRLLACLPA